MNKVKSLKPELEKYWSENNSIPFDSITIDQNQKMLWKCSNGHEFEDSVKKIYRRKNFTCQECNREKSIAYNYPHLLKYWDNERNSFNPFNSSIYSISKVWWKFPNGHSIKSDYSKHINNFTCFKCTPKKTIYLKDKFPELKELYSENNTIDFDEVEYISNGYEHFLWACQRGHEWKRTAYNQAKINKECRYCKVGGSIFEHLKELPYGIIWDYKNNHISPQYHPYNFKESIWLKCLYCNNSFKRNFKEQVIKKRLCLYCSQNTSTGERELVALLRTRIKYIIYENYKEIPHVFEVDLFLPELNVAIDYNGEYWHSNNIAIKNGWESAEEKHRDKIERCRESDIRMLYVWEDDFYANKNEVIKKLIPSIIHHKNEEIFNRLISNRDN